MAQKYWKWCIAVKIVVKSRKPISEVHILPKGTIRSWKTLFLHISKRNIKSRRSIHGRGTLIMLFSDMAITISGLRLSWKWAEISWGWILRTISRSSIWRLMIRPPKEWLIPSNPKYYDIIHAFDDTDEIDWKQGAGIKTGDTVFMYVGSPVSAVLYKCKVTETDIPYSY